MDGTGNSYLCFYPIFSSSPIAAFQNGTTGNHSRDIPYSSPCSLYWNEKHPLKYKESSLITTRNVSVQTKEHKTSGRNLPEGSEDSRDQSLKTLSSDSLLPLKKRHIYFEENSVSEPFENFSRADLDTDHFDRLSSPGSQMKPIEFELESDDQQCNLSYEKHKAEMVHSQEILTHCNQYYSMPSLMCTIDELHVSFEDDYRADEHNNDQDEHNNDQDEHNNDHGLDLTLQGSILLSCIDTPQGSVRSDVEINGSQDDEQMQQDDSAAQQISIDNQQEISEYSLLDDSKHEAETHAALVNLSVLKQKELEELESSIAIGSVLSHSPSNHSEPDLKSRNLQGNDTEELETSSVDIAADRHSDSPLQQSLMKGIGGALEEKGECDEEDMSSEIEKTVTAEKETLQVNSRFLQPVLRVRNSRRKKRNITVEHCSSSFTRLPRREQMMIDPMRALKLREENNRACRKNRLKRVQKMRELEKELTRLKEIVER